MRCVANSRVVGASTTMAKDSNKRDNGVPSHFPGWYAAIQQQLFIPAIILVEALVYGTMFTWGLAPSGSWDTWDWATRGLVAVMFVGGFLCGGMVLRCSLKSAACFGRGSYGFALFNFLGILLFVGPEIWAGIVERSQGFPLTTPDRLLLQSLGITPDQSVIAPSVLVIAVLPALVGLFYGFSEEKAESEDPAEIEKRAAIQEAKVRAKARVRNARALGWADTFQQVKASVSHEEDGAPTAGNPGDIPTDSRDRFNGATLDYGDALDQAAPNVTPLRTKGKGNYWTADDLIAYVETNTGYKLSRGEAVHYIKAMRNAKRLEGITGEPWAAHRQTVIAWARNREWPSTVEGTA